MTGIFIGKGEREHRLLLKLANRHGLVAGATGTGKTVTLKVMAEGFSRAGVPVFVADVKGDLAGIAMPGEPGAKLTERAHLIGLGEPSFAGSPTVLWDLHGERGHPVRTTVTEMGPLLLSRLLQLNDVQEGVLNIAFRVADEEGLLLLDLKDLQALLAHLAENASALTTLYGNVTKASIGAIQRPLLVLETQGADRFFGEPALAISDLMATAPDGRGVVNVLAAERLVSSPRLYSTFLLWLLSELFEALPEVGDPEKPRLVFFFDEAHLLFDEAPKHLLERIEQVVRLIRSKGVGVYFVTQNPVDVPDTVLGQLGNRVQHALRAFTARDQKALAQAAETFRVPEGLDVARVVQELGVGEALVSFLDEAGVPEYVEPALIRPPMCRFGPLSEEERAGLIAGSAVGARYAMTIDRESAYEKLRAATASAAAAPASAPSATRAPAGGPTMIDRLLKSTAHSVGSTLGRSLVRGVLGSILR